LLTKNRKLLKAIFFENRIVTKISVESVNVGKARDKVAKKATGKEKFPRAARDPGILKFII